MTITRHFVDVSNLDGSRRRVHYRRAGMGPPVLLIHGYLATRGSLHLLERHLTGRGLVVMSYPMGLVNLGDIRDSIAELRYYRDAVFVPAPGPDSATAKALGEAHAVDRRQFGIDFGRKGGERGGRGKVELQLNVGRSGVALVEGESGRSSDEQS